MTHRLKRILAQAVLDRWRIVASLCLIMGFLTASSCPPSPTPTRAVPGHNSLWLSRHATTTADTVPYYRTINALGDTLSNFKQRNGFNAATEVSAVYFNAGDLNLGRGMHCTQNNDVIACYVSNFGPVPAQQGFPNSTQALSEAIVGTSPFATVAMETALEPTPKTVSVRERDGVPTTNQGVQQCPFTGNDGPPTGVDVDTGLDLFPGDTVDFSATGTIWSGVCLAGQNPAAGWNTISNNPDLPLSGTAPYSLIGKVGTGVYFLIGDSLSYTHRGQGGRLKLRTNDEIPGNGTGSFSVTVTVHRQVRFYVYGPPPAESLQNNAALDTEGAKPVPGLCLACHGGRYDPQTLNVTGASFLPFDVFSFVFSAQPGFTLVPDQQEKFRQLNSLVKKTGPNKANPNNPIVEFIDGLYSDGTVDTPGTAANNRYVPTDWLAQQSVYNIVIKPYCRTCHIAMGPANDWTKRTQFIASKPSIQNSVCNLHDMPHAEVPFLKFWTSSPVYVPGYLEDQSVLGVTGCAQ